MADGFFFDTVILGAGAAGMMCAAHAASRGGRVMLIDHAKAAGEKIRISGGGRCNFTNLNTAPRNFLSNNPHFCKSALKRYTQADFIALVERYKIAYHEKTLGQLFCDGSSKQIVEMLLEEMRRNAVELRLSTRISAVDHEGDAFRLVLEHEGREMGVRCANLVIATGGKSIPKMGATGFGYQLAEKFGLAVLETRAALVPLTFGTDFLERYRPLAGVAVDARISCGKTTFEEAMLFTHRGLSGPSILQISSYWRETTPIRIDMLPSTDVFRQLKARKQSEPKKAVATILGDIVPKRLGNLLCDEHALNRPIGETGDKALQKLADAVHRWEVKPVGTEGYRTAEVTLGGVGTNGLDSRTMEAKTVPGLYFIGEVVDVTGWLGGYNFQWAWSSGWAAGNAIASKG
ncbi:NAD(P)/FAD-dependent oxidoreductase [Limoniibacter endophyticus]|uniref:NAD(P)/FAD-dependent oxidoreductase n=1 Tax=Limoniibacter endophyticus TaxID=1565040 RepID=A0A8J3DI36_9HYPH|nr:NAD(P)/FAD-dependent oxidoreductase [Limoniibacter endophyticus]GHC69150.1 hypothetical protein GCM10010136_14610 [Limoniibacter endophyticus]